MPVSILAHESKKKEGAYPMIYIPSQDPPYTNDTTVSISQNVVLDADGIQDLAMKGKKFEYHFIFILLYYLQTVIEGVILLNKLVLNCQQFRNGTISTRNLEVNLEKQATVCLRKARSSACIESMTV